MATKPKKKRKPAPKKKSTPARKGRPPSYRDEYADNAYKLCLLGATNEELADFFGVNPDTIYEWKAKVPAFSESIRRGKMMADAEVASKLYHRAIGYTHEAVKIMMVDGKPEYLPYTEHYAPDTAAADKWLRNRQPEKWRDKQLHEHTGKDGGKIETETTVLTAEEAYSRMTNGEL